MSNSDITSPESFESCPGGGENTLQPLSTNPPPSVRVFNSAQKAHETQTHDDPAYMSTHSSQVEPVTPIGCARPAVLPMRILREIQEAKEGPGQGNGYSLYQPGSFNMNKTSSLLRRDDPPFPSSMGHNRELPRDARSTLGSVEERRRSSASTGDATVIEMLL